uniref:Uncharacterized protein n=1 Tax=Marseillevirus sp. TaxID=2809551 RepID=A0AA96IY54_9VIRU|nr:hypothetical protein MarFTMF_330 [Marseillevirus sp.]
MSRKFYQELYMESIWNGQRDVSECMRKFTDQHKKDPNFVPEDFSCLSKVSSHWAKISGFCSFGGCERIAFTEGWEGQHRHFVKVLGHLRGEKDGFFKEEVFDSGKVFGK